jgi:hypothetical protein
MQRIIVPKTSGEEHALSRHGSLEEPFRTHPAGLVLSRSRRMHVDVLIRHSSKAHYRTVSCAPSKSNGCAVCVCSFVFSVLHAVIMIHLCDRLYPSVTPAFAAFDLPLFVSLTCAGQSD